jgi:hypothetical protein
MAEITRHFSCNLKMGANIFLKPSVNRDHVFIYCLSNNIAGFKFVIFGIKTSTWCGKLSMLTEVPNL